MYRSASKLCLSFASVLLCFGLSVGCHTTPASQGSVASLDSVHTIDPTQLAADGAGPVQLGMANSHDGTHLAGAAAFITQTALVRREAKDTKDIEVAGSKKRLSNFTATLYRGEQVDVVKSSGDWLEVRTSDEKTGWLKIDNALRADGVEMVTIVNAAKVFTRPDLLALNGAKVLMPGTLLFALRPKDQFTEVNLGGTTTGWLLTDVLVKDKREVDVAKLINKARLLKDRNDPAAAGLLELAKMHFADTHLTQALLLASPIAADSNSLDLPTANAAPALVDGLPQPAGPSGLGAPGVVATPQQDPAANQASAPIMPVGLPPGGVDTAPSAPATDAAP